jgi:hypothetical protein
MDSENLRFSQRIGKKPIKAQIQIDSMDNDLQVSLWNLFYTCFLKLDIYFLSGEDNPEISFSKLWQEFFKIPVDQDDEVYEHNCAKLKKWFFECEWFDIYDLLEYAVKANALEKSKYFREQCNRILERELAGYRFISTTITPITNQIEIRAIEDAILKAETLKTNGINAHIQSALAKLSDRKNPDYRNSIKESISAVEAFAQLISENPKAELGSALSQIKDRVGLHPALVRGFSAIYGYTSDADGIRHAMLEESTVGFEDAQYMLVSCSAFVHYLIMKMEKADLGLK